MLKLIDKYFTKITSLSFLVIGMAELVIMAARFNTLTEVTLLLESATIALTFIVGLGLLKDKLWVLYALVSIVIITTIAKIVSSYTPLLTKGTFSTSTTDLSFYIVMLVILFYRKNKYFSA